MLPRTKESTETDNFDLGHHVESMKRQLAIEYGILDDASGESTPYMLGC